ncbi:MAG TPA: 50S ribosomal protein L20 [Candidatus Pacearchaeota archaeon]|nr:50S ribosomal protein L20 [Candidatus Parcubacteria bacterium]HNP79325.1 50S ribosomal protein L20 [Candidatus Pacearchaeota archaeon]HOC53879.1 50S ribosomal protein L20 [Candidatus Pacearchaeota archaeon]HQM24602.1 50S ribosomal protein L20 [Candidatus Pacearchaeota archaeon]
MARVKRGTIANKRRKKVLKQTKGFRWGRKSKYKEAKQALMKALSYATRDRKVKKRVKRALWQVQLSAFLKEKGLSYNKFIAGMKKKDIQIDRKILSILVKEKPEAVEKIIEMIK